MPIEQFFGTRMVRVLGAGRPPALPDLVTRMLEHLFVSRVLPLHEILDNLEKPLAFFLLLLLRLENIRMRGRIVHHLRKDHRPRRRQRPPRPPQMQRDGCPWPDRLLPRRRFVNGFQGQGDFDEFFLVGHFVSGLFAANLVSSSIQRFALSNLSTNAATPVLPSDPSTKVAACAS